MANLLGLELEVREYDGDPVQWVIGKNLHRRHLNGVAAWLLCVNAACIDWAKQGHQKNMHTERGEEYGPVHRPIDLSPPVKLTGHP